MPTRNIGRNEPCFCGSGKKYKLCCMGKPAPAAETSDFPFATVSEAFALRSLLAESKPFRAFYNAERSKITGEIYWTDTLMLPPDIAAQAIRLPRSKLQAIYLRRIPALPPDALAVAHELMHLVLDTEGFPFIASRSERQPLAALLNSMVQDPLVDARLRAYGFDIARKIRKDIAAALAGLRQAEQPSDPITRMMWVLSYASQVLEWKVVAPDAVREQGELFVRWFSAHQPTIAAEGDELLASVQRSGFDTPERMRAFFTRMARRHKLAGDLIVDASGSAAEQ